MDTAQLTLVRQPFDHPDFLYELKHDGFRALAHINGLMFMEDSMDILVALKQEEVKLQRQLKGIQGAIFTLNGSHPAPVSSKLVSPNGVSRKRTMSVIGRAKISKASKEYWAKFRAEKAKRAK
jgi:hypothetical protein